VEPHVTQPAQERVGVITNDPLRLAGLTAICSDALGVEIVPMTVSAGLKGRDPELVLIDAETTPQLFEVIAALRSTHPRVKLLILGTTTSHEYV